MLTTRDRDKLVRVLRLLASDHDGERAAAGQAAARLVQAIGSDWDQLLVPTAPVAPARTATSDRGCTAGTWRGRIAFLLNRPDALTEWERRFLRSATVQGRLTAKQMATLDGIHRRVVLWEAGP